MIRIFERTAITQHTFPSIAASDATGGGVLTIADPSSGEKNSFSGILREMKVVCNSTDFDVIIKSSRNAPSDSIHRVHFKDGANKFSHEKNLDASWINNSDPKASELYVFIVNRDGDNETGPIKIQLMNDVQKRWSAGK